MKEILVRLSAGLLILGSVGLIADRISTHLEGKEDDVVTEFATMESYPGTPGELGENATHVLDFWDEIHYVGDKNRLEFSQKQADAMVRVLETIHGEAANLPILMVDVSVFDSGTGVPALWVLFSYEDPLATEDWFYAWDEGTESYLKLGHPADRPLGSQRQTQILVQDEVTFLLYSNVPSWENPAPFSLHRHSFNGGSITPRVSYSATFMKNTDKTTESALDSEEKESFLQEFAEFARNNAYDVPALSSEDFPYSVSSWGTVYGTLLDGQQVSVDFTREDVWSNYLGASADVALWHFGEDGCYFATDYVTSIELLAWLEAYYS